MTNKTAKSHPRLFRLHFNRNNMQAGNNAVWTIHLSDRCIPAENVLVMVPVRTVYKATGRQPRACLRGKGFVHSIPGIEGHYIITDQAKI